MTTPIRTEPDDIEVETQTSPDDVVTSPADDETSGETPSESAIARGGAAPESDVPASTAGSPEGGEAREAGKSRPLQSIIDLLHDLAIAVLVCVLLITYVVQAFKVQGTSMSPELLDGERILVNKFLYRLTDIERGDVVVFWYPDDPELSFIKRVVGLPGETVEVRDGDVYVDGARLDESYVIPNNADHRSFAAQEIRPGHYFVLGDNRRGSNDSRSWGLVPERYIYGKAFLKIWPPGDVGAVD